MIWWKHYSFYCPFMEDQMCMFRRSLLKNCQVRDSKYVLWGQGITEQHGNYGRDEFLGFWWFQIKVSSAIRKYSVAMKYFVSRNGVKQRSNYLRTHLAADRCTKWIEVKHRCSQTWFRAVAVDAELLSGVPTEGGWQCHSPLRFALPL